MIEEVKIKVTSDNKGADDTIKKLEQIGAVDAKNAANFKKHNADQKAQFNEMGNVAGKAANHIEQQFSQLGAQIMGYMALDKLIGFLKDSVNAFFEAEKNANALKFAVMQVGQESETSFQSLINQSAELQKISIYSDDDIQKAQTQLVNYGLTAREVEKLIPKVLDLASATGQDLSSATDTVIKGINGQTKGLKTLGIDYKDTGDKAKNLAILTEQLAKFQGKSNDALDTGEGKWLNFKNQIGDLSEDVGDFLVTLIELPGALFQNRDATDAWTGSLEELEAEIKRINALTAGLVTQMQKEDYEKAKKNGADGLALERMKNAILLSEKQKYADEAKALEDKKLEDDLKRLEDDLAAKKLYFVTELDLTQSQQIEILKAELAARKKGALGDDEDGAGNGGGVDKLKDLTDQINAIYAQMWLDQLNLQRNALKQKALEDKKFADETITDIVARNQAILEIDQKLYDDLEVLDAEQINKKADDDKARALKEHSSQKQINELVLAIENKRVADILSLDEKYAQDKLTNEEQNWDLMLEQLTNERNDLVVEHNKTTEQLKKLEVERYKETQELRVALQKTGSKAEQAAKMQNLKEDFDKELQLLEITHDNKLMSDEDYLRKRALLYANYNKAVADSTKELAEKQKQDILDIFDLMSSAIFDRIEQMINQNIELIDRQQEMVRSDIEHQKRLAEEGRDNTLQESERQFAELEKQRIIQQEKLRKAKEFEILLNTVAEYSKTDPNTAIAKAIAQMALLKGAEALYMEEGGIIGETSQHSKIGGLGFSRLHPGGGDVLVHAQSGEGILSRDEMSNLGKSGFYDLKSMLSKPLRERQIPLVGVVGSSGFDKKEMAQGFNMVVDAIKSKKETHFEVDHMNNWVVTQIEHGMKEVVTHVNRKPRI